jgi:nitrite reductase/ring-hydroxylating ferredoxin subunit
MADEANSVVRVCAESEVAPGSVKAYAVGDKTLAVFNIDGTFYVTDDECTHAAASLADAMIDGDVAECCMHMGSFHIPSAEVGGAVLRGAAAHLSGDSPGRGRVRGPQAQRRRRAGVKNGPVRQRVRQGGEGGSDAKGVTSSSVAAASLRFADAECRQLCHSARILQGIAGFSHQMRNVDAGERIGALHQKHVAWRQSGKRLAGKSAGSRHLRPRRSGIERRERTFEAAEIV